MRSVFRPSMFSRAIIIVAALIVTHGSALAGKIYWNRSPRCATCGVRQYEYQTAAGVTAAAVVAVATADQPRDLETAAAGTAPGAEATPQPSQNLRKAFFADVNSVVVDDVTLSRLGLAFYSSGRYACSAQLGFDGGPDGALEGANVVVRLRAYSGVPQQAGNINNMRLLWETQEHYWIAKNESKTISLIPNPPCAGFPIPPGVDVLTRNTGLSAPSNLIRNYFKETTHLEVVLEHHHDR